MVTPVYAQDKPDLSPNGLLRFAANNEIFDKEITEKGRSSFLALTPSCSKVDKVSRQLPTLLTSVVFKEPEPYAFAPPVSGQWMEKLRVTGCNQTKQVNVFATAQGGSYPTLLATLPGTTRADPAAQRDAENIAAFTMNKTLQACMATPILLSGDLIGYLNDKNQIQATDAGRGWFENWHFQYCEMATDVQIAFIPSANGGYQIKARVVQPAPAPAKPAKP